MTMKNLSRDVQISTISDAGILSAIEEVAGKLSGEELKFVGKKLTYGHILNGLILLLMDYPEAERLSLGRRAISRLEDWALERDTPEDSKQFEARGHPLVVLPKPKSKKSISD